MANNIFGGGEKEQQKEFKEKVDTHSRAILTVVERQKDLENSIDLINEKIELLDHNTIKSVKKLMNDLKVIRDDVRDLKHDAKELKEFNVKVQKQLQLMTTKDEVEKLEKYIDLWQPMDFVTRQELSDFRSKIKSDIEKIIENFLDEE
jgi:predicted  nucleic acid-binding Zn-ribbon protein